MSLTQSLHRTVQQRPDSIATRCLGRQRSYGELADRIGRLAAALQSLGLRSGDAATR